MKRCKAKGCAERFEASGFVCWCSAACGASIAQERVAKKRAKALAIDRKETKAKLEAIKPRSKWLKEAEQAFNAWVRARDARLCCISCGTRFGKVNAGHYRSVGACPELRFEPLNVHWQCERCNTHLHGNLIDYRRNLIDKIGMRGVEWLEGPHTPKHYTIEDLKAIKNIYRQKTKELMK